MANYSYLQGGLGNQMFQYAIARALSEHYQSPLRLNCSWFETTQKNTTPRPYQLDLLNISQAQLDKAPFPDKPGKLKRLLQNLLPVSSVIYYQKNAFAFDSSLFCLKQIDKRNLYLFGYWQAFPYIDSIRKILQKEFQLKKALSNHYQKFLIDIQACDSVMLHIRRGDYISSPSAARFHGVLPLSYYLKAIDQLLAKRPDIHVFVFSDDLAWAKASLPHHLKITFIENSLDAEAAAQELQLMYACKHHIIANSSLSWWGAWLKKDPNGMVFAPSQWISDDSIDLSHLLPSQWHRISAS